MDKTEWRLVAWWALLVLATLASWHSGRTGTTFAVAPSVAVIVLAFAKVATVMMQYMEVRTAPWFLKIGLGLWTLGVGSAVTILWLHGS